jgi:single-strand DNA-binding protein
MSYNKTILMGNLTRDPEVHKGRSDMVIVTFTLAISDKYKDQERTDFVDVKMFGKRGEAFAKFHNKGERAFIEGRLRLDTWEDKNGGGKRSKLYVVGDNFEFVGRGKEAPGGSGGARGGAQEEDPWERALTSTPF